MIKIMGIIAKQQQKNAEIIITNKNTIKLILLVISQN